tara:strand:+ start:126 stop:353 length:228 start_codon:yes stop_codon:yes gene_type:complete
MNDNFEEIEELQTELCNLIEEITSNYPDIENQTYIKNHLDTLVASLNFWSKENNPYRIKYDIVNSFDILSSCFPC